jgi:hypothetical protein
MLLRLGHALGRVWLLANPFLGSNDAKNKLGVWLLANLVAGARKLSPWLERKM